MPRQSLLHLKIMIVDNNPLDLLLLQDMLSEEGYSQLKSLTDAALSVEMYRAFNPDLLIFGLNNSAPITDAPTADASTADASTADASTAEASAAEKRANALPWIKQLRAQVEETDYRPILALLEASDRKLKRQVLEGGATDFLVKPLDHTDAVLRVGNLLRARLFHLARQQLVATEN